MATAIVLIHALMTQIVLRETEDIAILCLLLIIQLNIALSLHALPGSAEN